jgi:hypothetical protein
MNSLLLDMKLTPEQRSYAEGVQMGTELLVELFSDLYGTNFFGCIQRTKPNFYE